MEKISSNMVSRQHEFTKAEKKKRKLTIANDEGNVIALKLPFIVHNLVRVAGNSYYFSFQLKMQPQVPLVEKLLSI